MGSIQVGDSDFSLSHAHDMLNIPSFLFRNQAQIGTETEKASIYTLEKKEKVVWEPIFISSLPKDNHVPMEKVQNRFGGMRDGA